MRGLRREKCGLVVIVVGFSVIALIGCSNPLGPDGEESDDSGEPQEQAESVSFNPEGGTHNEDISVTLSSKTDGATIYYTTDGSEPDSDSEQYTDTIEVAGHGSDTTIKAIAVAKGYTDSAIAEASYEIDYDTAAMPEFDPAGGTHNEDISVTLSSKTDGATIYYTTDGSDPDGASEEYTDPIAVAGDGTKKAIKAIAVADGFTDSSIAEASYEIDYEAAAMPEFDPVGGAYEEDIEVALSSETAGATIHYTTDGSEPDGDSTKYTDPIEVAGDGTETTIKAIAAADGYNDSSIADASYTVEYPQAATPSFDHDTGTYSGVLDVEISSETEGATIYYELGADPPNPTSYSNEVTGAIAIQPEGRETEVTLKAIAVADKHRDSGIAEATYRVFDLSEVDHRGMITVPGGTFTQEDHWGGFVHTISAFDMAQYEVTYELWYTVREWAEDNGYMFENAGTQGNDGGNGVEPGERRHEPVTVVNWYDMVVWANAYSEMAGLDPVYYLDSGHTDLATDASAELDVENEWVDWEAGGYRLPTEGEWQYAASWRGTDDSDVGVNEYPEDSGNYWTPPDWPSGGNDAYGGENENNEEVAWFDNNSENRTHPVGEKEANQLGIYDMSGNVWERMWDWGASYPDGPETDYRGPSDGSSGVVRGGGWGGASSSLRVGWRGVSAPSGAGDDSGFRLLRTP